MRFLAAVAVLLTTVTMAAGQTAYPVNPTGTYTTQWVDLEIFYDPTAPAMTTGTGTIDVMTVINPVPGGPRWEMRDRTTGNVRCLIWDDGRAQCGEFKATIEWFDSRTSEFSADTYFYLLDVEICCLTTGHLWEVGTKQIAAPSGISFTNLTNGQTITGTIGVKMVANGAGTGPYRWYLSVDGKQISYRIESTTSITFWWNTGGVPNGAHTLSVKVVNAAGKALTGSINVNVKH